MLSSGLVTLGVAIAKLVLRWRDLNDTADATEDAKTAIGALASLVRRKDAADSIGRAIAERLQQRLPRATDQRADDIAAAAQDVAVLMNRYATDSDAILAAALSPTSFIAWAGAHGGDKMRAQIAEHAETVFDEVLAAACNEFGRLAPASPLFQSVGLLQILSDTALLPGIADDVNRILTDMPTALATLDEALDYSRRGALAAEAVRDRQLVPAARVIKAGERIGKPVNAWNAVDLGVHESIAAHDRTGLTPYIIRDHDVRLRQTLADLAGPDARSALVIAVGTSCAGKTRALYEAVLAVLPEWHLARPRNAGELCDVLTSEIPKRTIIWLDELQDYLTFVEDGPRAAQYLRDLFASRSDGDRPLLVAATTWPSNLALMTERPQPGAAATGAGAIFALLKRAWIVDITEAFADIELEEAKDSSDPRLRTAARTAARTDHPEGGWRVTQVLAGGPALVTRLHPPKHEHVERPFSPAARAVLHAAGDLRRAGLNGPIPRWAIEGAAPGYLSAPSLRPDHTWLPAALDETTRDATRDDAFTDTRTHDNRRHGVPALTPAWTSHPVTGAYVDAYVLHDYLYQDHLDRHASACTRQALWDTLVAGRHDLRPDIRARVGESAARRGMVTPALLFWTEQGELAELPTAPKVERALVLWGVLGDVGSLARAARSGNWQAESILAVVLGARRRIDSPSYHDVHLTAEYYDGLGFRGELDDPSSTDIVVQAWREIRHPSCLGQADPEVQSFIEMVQSRHDLEDRAGKWLLPLLYRRYPDDEQLETLRIQALKGDLRAQRVLCDAYRARHDVHGLRELVHLAAPDAAASLTNVLRVIGNVSERVETELDVRGELLPRDNPGRTARMDAASVRSSPGPGPSR